MWKYTVKLCLSAHENPIVDLFSFHASSLTLVRKIDEIQSHQIYCRMVRVVDDDNKHNQSIDKSVNHNQS